MHNLRLYDPQYHVEVALRCDNGAFRFDLNDTDLRDEIYGLFAEATHRYAVAVFAFHFMSDHYHGLYGFESPDELVAFFAFLHGNLARLGHRYRGTHGAFWSPLKVMAVATDEASVARRIRYIMAQAVAQELVDHPEKFPGASSVDAMLTGRPLKAKRVNYTQKCRDTARLAGGAKADQVYETWTELQLAVPPCWADLGPEELQRLYRGIADDIALKGRPAVPASQDAKRNSDDSQAVGECPTAEPAAKQPAPTRSAEDGGTFRLGRPVPKDRGRRRSRPPRLYCVDPRVVQAFEERYRTAVAEYREAKSAWRLGSLQVDGVLRGAPIALPAWMLLGTLPLKLRRGAVAKEQGPFVAKA